MRAARYLASFIVPAVVLVSLLLEGPGAFLAPVVLFVGFPLLELVLSGTTQNLTTDEERDERGRRAYDLVLYAMVPTQFALLALYLTKIAAGAPTAVEAIGWTMSMGMACGVLGINVAHELGHRRRRYEQRMAKALLTTSLYAHFFIEHNRGHHARVSTPDDPASARYGETLYTFFVRSIVGAWLSAWELERDRLERRGERVYSWRNEMVRLQIAQVSFVALIAVAFGPIATVGFVAAAGIGALLLETVNYIEHYGLTRRRFDDGRYERVLPIHSWNSNHPVGRIVLFELTRHSDHHANARRRYQVLRHFDESPQLPTGYPGMMVLAWFPPLWFGVMHRLIAHHEAEYVAATDLREGALAAT